MPDPAGARVKLKPVSEEDLTRLGVGTFLAQRLEPEYYKATQQLAASNFHTWATQSFAPAVVDAATARVFCEEWEAHRHTSEADIHAITKLLQAYSQWLTPGTEEALPPGALQDTYGRLVEALRQVSEQLCGAQDGGRGGEQHAVIWLSLDTLDRYLRWEQERMRDQPGRSCHPKFRHLLLVMLAALQGKVAGHDDQAHAAGAAGCRLRLGNGPYWFGFDREDVEPVAARGVEARQGESAEPQEQVVVASAPHTPAPSNACRGGLAGLAVHTPLTPPPQGPAFRGLTPGTVSVKSTGGGLLALVPGSEAWRDAEMELQAWQLMQQHSMLP